jgi:hypothetical protein
MPAPQYNPTGEPGGPFNIFDIRWADPTMRTCTVVERIGLDVPVCSTITNTALWVSGGGNTEAERGNNVSSCWADPTSGEKFPPLRSGPGNATRFGRKTNGFRLPGFFCHDGHLGGSMRGQCCADGP